MSHAERRVVVGDRGRIVLPAEVRAALGLSEGTPLLLRTEPDGSLRLTPYAAVARASRGELAKLGPPTDAVNELLRERRRETARESS
jgi:AbrB family looped-hinge helix DNA binding protein